MTTKRFIIQTPEGVAVVKPYAPRLEDETEAAYIARVHARTVEKWLRDGKLPPGDYPLVVIEHEEIPQDRSYRDAWTFNGKFDHDLNKARELHKEKLRLARVPLLQDLDIQVSKALASGKPEVAPLEAERQKLRDITADPRIEVAQTIDDLKKVTV